ncbi:MAG TPA: AI-2E family transporter, partial [Isosphaeraceae bacterium]|nr:AI-2E family transporter [Isosphaeraceae bacterium]
MDRLPREASRAQVILAVLAVIAALYMLKAILIPVAVALVVSCMLSPVASFLRRHFPYGPLGAFALLLLSVVSGLYLASLMAESLMMATYKLPSDLERLAGQVSGRITDLIRDQPSFRSFLPEPGTIDRLGDTNRALLIEKLSYGLTDFTTWVAQGFVILVLVIFLLIESEMLTAKVIRFFARQPAEAKAAGSVLTLITRKIRAYLIARTLINAGLGVVIALALWSLNVQFALTLGLVAGITNFIPYLGQLIGGALPTAIVLGQTGSMGHALAVAGIYLAVVGIEGYVVTPLVMGRSLDLNGTTVLLACLFWGYLWGLIGLVLAMPITVSLKVVLQTIPELNRWAELMSLDWQSPAPA